MPRPEPKQITFTIDGREVTAAENTMLVDAAKHGDVEIPIFCYEPKLGQPVGACRMCLVEIEGIPKLQTGCSTPVKDGMVVHTQTERVHEAQRAVVEFLLINHPLDCPVCDKGGECPLQDISYGWGGGTSRFIEPKRHFRKPLELSPLIAIDRERCILCYRCVRFSQEISEDYQLVLLERGAHTFVGTFDGHPYVAPFSGNIVELCPVGALTSSAYRFRARPWDIEGAGTVCTLCPAQCNVHLTVRDDRVLRVLSRHNDGVDDGWLCDKGRYAYQSFHVDERLTTPLARDGDELRPVSWERALDEAAAALQKGAGGKAAALAGDGATNEEGFLLQRLLRDALDSHSLDTRLDTTLPLDLERALADPARGATVPDVEWAHTVLVLDADPLDEMPILDLRLRKGVRRHKVALHVASSRPNSLDPNAASTLRFAPGGGEALLVALAATVSGEGDVDGAAAAAGVDADGLRSLARSLTDGGEDVVIVYGERLLAGPAGANAATALLALTDALGLNCRDGGGLLEVPTQANARGLREAGCVAAAGGPGYADATNDGGRSARQIADGIVHGDISALYLLGADPLRTHPDRKLWDRALSLAPAVIAHASVLTDGLREHATVVFPAEAYAEKEGTVTHPDGRVQRLRPAIGHQGEVRATWQILAAIAERLGQKLDVQSGGIATEQLLDAVPFYDGLTLEALAGRGERWAEHAGASRFPAPSGPFAPQAPQPAPPLAGLLRLGTYRPIWAAPEVEISPALKFLAPQQVVELSPRDAERLGVHHGERVTVRADGTTINARVALRDAVPEGSTFLADAIGADSANALTNGAAPLVEVRRA
jgi:NADH-quinone oxidoreductase subunit G